MAAGGGGGWLGGEAGGGKRFGLGWAGLLWAGAGAGAALWLGGGLFGAWAGAGATLKRKLVYLKMERLFSNRKKNELPDANNNKQFHLFLS